MLKILYRLDDAGYTAYLVGGGVRDLMMGRRPKDFDIATSAHPQQVRDLFRNSRLIGRRFRLVHVFFGQQNIEVSTFRRRAEDVVEGDDPMIRHDNTFGTPEEDAFRRDFTINALFYDPRTFEVIDYVGGVPDLEARLIRTIGDPEVRMREDPVRMIRAVRFATKLDFEIEPATRAAIEHHSGDLAKSSVPRLVEEIFRTLGLKGAERALFLMEQLGLLEVLLPKLSAHLRASVNLAEGELENTATARNLAALGSVIETGDESSRPLILACLFADFHHVAIANAGESQRLMLVEFLRECGFSRADTDHMRLLLEAATHMRMRTRLARRIVRRPYYPQARLFFELIAPTYNIEVEAFDRFLSEARDHPHHRRDVSTIPSGLAGREFNTAPASAPPGRRRRRRRGGRRRRDVNGSAAQILIDPTVPPDVNLLPHRSSLSDVAAPVNQPLQGNTDILSDGAALGAPDHHSRPHPR